MRKIYCVTYRNIIKPYYGYIRPWNAVRDDETWSLTYLTPSMIDGIGIELGIENKIVRHKLVFDKTHMETDFTKCVVYCKNNKRNQTVHKRHTLVNPIITLGFETYEDAMLAMGLPIYCGQNIYPIYPFVNDGIKEMTDAEFDELYGVETFETNEEDEKSIYEIFIQIEI